ncbi:MAG TPA: hypothetical protein VGD60_18715 [Candidatus Acidoferrales bacterium]
MNSVSAAHANGQSEAAASGPRNRPADFINDSYAKLNACSRILFAADIEPTAGTKIETSLFEIADQALLMAHVEDDLTRIDQIRLLEIEKLVGKILTSIHALARNRDLQFQDPRSGCSAA